MRTIGIRKVKLILKGTIFSDVYCCANTACYKFKTKSLEYVRKIWHPQISLFHNGQEMLGSFMKEHFYFHALVFSRDMLSS